MINDLEKSNWQHLFSLPHNPRTPSGTGKQQLPRAEAHLLAGGACGPPQYQKTVWSWNLARVKHVLCIYADNEIIHVLLSTAVILAEPLWEEASL